MFDAILTGWRALRQLAVRAGIRNPADYDVVCAKCQAPVGIFGLAHWPDCDASDDDIRFIPKRPTSSPRRSRR